MVSVSLTFPEAIPSITCYAAHPKSILRSHLRDMTNKDNPFKAVPDRVHIFSPRLPIPVGRPLRGMPTAHLKKQS